ncbi:hypothetical protein [Bacillus sp. B-jedd]|uniref:hypothetical protein n=1 Tax=Bacillus sp. B-jedd TaxID=1476857 RepID=UPI0005156EAB|nr:hypothetical protein [Bacillus sp. B-jedd]CEG27196.1 hypothetical protein BN1002_02052 [Bacillus sp. B-jedd]
MANIIFQFHATKSEIIEVVKNSQNLFDLYMFSAKLFPEFEYLLISKNEFEEKLSFINDSNMIFLLVSKPQDIMPNDYLDFVRINKNCLVFQLGRQNEKFLTESSIGTLADDKEALKVWQKVIKDYKKTMLKGAWIYNEMTELKVFNKNHYYSETAQKLYKEGAEIRQFVGGSNLYYLNQDL